MVVLDLDVLPPDIKRRNWGRARTDTDEDDPFTSVQEPSPADGDDAGDDAARRKSLKSRALHGYGTHGHGDGDNGSLEEVKVVVKQFYHKTSDSMLCCGRRKDQGRDIPHDAEPAASPRRLQLGQIATLPPPGVGRGGRELPPMVLQPDFRKVSGISSEIFKQLEAVENDHDATTAAALDAVERRGEMLVRMLDPRNQFNRTRQDLVRKFITMQDGLHTVHFVEIVKRPGQTLGLYIREGNGLDRYDGVFISRIAIESAVFNSGCLGVGDEILAVNLIDVTHMSLDDVVIIMSIPRRLVLTIRQRKGRVMSGAGSLLRDTSKIPPVVVMKKEQLDDEAYDESNGDMMGHGPHSFSLGPSGGLGMARGRSPMMTTPGQRLFSQQMQRQQQQQGYNQPYQAPPHPGSTIQSLPRPSPSYQHYANLQAMQLQQSQLPDVTDYTPRITSRRDDFRLETPQPPIRRPQYSDYYDSRPEAPPRPSSQAGYPTSYDWYRSGGDPHRQLEPAGPSIAYQPPPPVITEQPRSINVPSHFQPFDRAYPKTLESLAEKVHTFYTGPRPTRQGRQMRMPRTGSDHRLSLSRSGDAQQWYGSMPRQRPGPSDYRSPAMQQQQPLSRYSLGPAGVGAGSRLSVPPPRRAKPVLDYASDSEAMMYTPSIRSSSGLGALSASTRRSLGLTTNGGRSNSLPRDFIRGGRAGGGGIGRKHNVRFDNHKRSTLIPDIQSSLAAGRRALLLASGMDSQDESDGAASAPEMPTPRRDRGLGGLGRIVPSSPGVFSSGDYRSWLTRAPSTSAIYERLKTNRDLELLQTQRAAKFTYSAENLSLLDRTRQDQPYYSYRSHLLGSSSGLTGGDSTLARALAAARSPSASSALASLGIRDPLLKVSSSLSKESLTSTDPLRRLALTPSRSRDLISESASAAAVASLRAAGAASPTSSLLQRLSEQRDRDREREREKDADSSIMLRKDILSRSLIGRDLLNRESLLKDDLHDATTDSIVSRLTGGAGAGLSGLTGVGTGMGLGMGLTGTGMSTGLLSSLGTGSGLGRTTTDYTSGLTRPDSSLLRERERERERDLARDGVISGMSGIRDGVLSGMSGIGGISGIGGLRDGAIQGILTRPSLTSSVTPAAAAAAASLTNATTAPGAAAAAAAAAGDSRLKLLTINPSEFVRYKIERPPSAASDMSGPGGLERHRLQMHGHSGILRVHLLAGRALRSTVRATDSSMVRTRDLYCVLECDRVHKARTVVCTGDQNFDWDEVFELDLVDNKELDFLIYSWDPQLRHRLCYKGSVSLLQILSDVSPNSAFHQLAIKVEPRGTLYVKLRHTPPQEAFRREMKNVGLFGADVANVVLREDSGLNVPLIVQRCIEEVERRGLDIIGLYRLCGSSSKKQILREAFERSPRTVDLSADNVPDINVIAGVLKDYLRELPEPLLTKCLYQMLVDALGVCLPDDPEGNARLLFSIIECLPKPNRCTLLLILEHLSLVCSLCDRNKMGPLQLATSFGPILMVYYDGSPESLDFQPPIKVLQYLLEVWPAKSVRAAGAEAARKGPTLSVKGRFPRSSPASGLLSKSQKTTSSVVSKSQLSGAQRPLPVSPTKQSPGSLSESSPSPTSVHSTKAQNIPAVSSVTTTAAAATSSSSGVLTLTPSTTSSSLTSVTTPNSLTPTTLDSTTKSFTPATSSNYSLTSEASDVLTTVISPTPMPKPSYSYTTEAPFSPKSVTTARTTGEDIFATVSVRNRASAFEQPLPASAASTAAVAEPSPPPREKEIQAREAPKPVPLPRERDFVPPSPFPGRKFQGPGHVERASSVEERLKRKLPPLPQQQSFPQPRQYSGAGQDQQQPPYSAPYQQQYASQSPFSQQESPYASQRLYSAPFPTLQQRHQEQQQPFGGAQHPYASQQPLYSSNSSSSSSSTATVIIGNGKLSSSPPVTTSEAQYSSGYSLGHSREAESYTSGYVTGSTSSIEKNKVPPQPPPKPGASASVGAREKETNILSGGGAPGGAVLRGNGEAKLISASSPPTNGGSPFSFQQWNIAPTTTGPAASAIPAATKYTIESEEFAAAAQASPGPSSKEASPRPTPGSTPPPSAVPPPVPPRLDRRPSQTSPTSSSPPSIPPPVPPRLGRAAPVRTPSFDNKEAFEVDCYTIKEENGEEDFLT